MKRRPGVLLAVTATLEICIAPVICTRHALRKSAHGLSVITIGIA
jgi:hypothetical protein